MTQRIYVAVAGTIQVPEYLNTDRVGERTIVQPAGRQIAQACHAVSVLRHRMLSLDKELKDLPSDKLMFAAYQMMNFIPVTTIILQARDSAELKHVFKLMAKNDPVFFNDTNEEYGPSSYMTAVAVLAAPEQTVGKIDYLPLWK